MPVNLDKVAHWKTDIALSVDMYNDWFMRFAPTAFRSTRLKTTKDVEVALAATGNLTNIQPSLLRQHPGVLPTLRMSTCPPIAVDRLIGLAGVSPTLVKTMEQEQKLPARMSTAGADAHLAKVAATIVADRLCGAVANPIIRNAQEKRQLAAIKTWLEARGYAQVSGGEGLTFDAMKPGTFSFRLNVPVKLEGGVQQVNIPVDAVIMPLVAKPGDYPILFEAKSAGEITRRREKPRPSGRGGRAQARAASHWLGG
jgi:type II restriction enzyme